MTIIWTIDFSFALKKVFEIILFFICFRVLLCSSYNLSYKATILKALTYSFFLTTLLILIDVYFVLGIKPWLSINFDNIFNPPENGQRFVNYFDFKYNFGKGMSAGSYNRALATLSIFSFIVIAANYKNRFLVSSLAMLLILTILLGESITAKLALVLSGLVALTLLIKRNIIAKILVVLLSSYLIFIPVIIKYSKKENWTEARRINYENLYKVTRNIEIQQIAQPEKINYILFLKKYYYISFIRFDHRFAIWNYTAEKIFEEFLFGHGLFSSKKLGDKDKLSLTEYNIDYKTTKIRYYPAIPLHPHNNALQIWLELGFFGILLFTLLLNSLFKKVLSFNSNNKISNCLVVGSFFCIIIINQSSFGFWQFWWLASISYWVIFVNILNTNIKPLKK